MQIERARLRAERLHADDYEEDGTALLEHVRRVASRVDADAQVVAWLHGWSPPYARGLAPLMHDDAAGPPRCRRITSAHAPSAVCRPDLPQGAGREVLFAQMDRGADVR
jgi:hypothetical protein